MEHVIAAFLVGVAFGGALVFWAMKRQQIKAVVDKGADVVREAVK